MLIQNSSHILGVHIWKNYGKGTQEPAGVLQNVLRLDLDGGYREKLVQK